MSAANTIDLLDTQGGTKNTLENVHSIEQQNSKNNIILFILMFYLCVMHNSVSVLTDRKTTSQEVLEY